MSGWFLFGFFFGLVFFNAFNLCDDLAVAFWYKTQNAAFTKKVYFTLPFFFFLFHALH